MRLYSYHGFISKMTVGSNKTGTKIDFIADTDDLEVAPTRLIANGPIADYIVNSVGSNTAEPHLMWDFYYDALLKLCAISIPAAIGDVPAKAVLSTDNGGLKVFGETEFINTFMPAPMDEAQYTEFSTTLRTRHI